MITSRVNSNDYATIVLKRMSTVFMTDNDVKDLFNILKRSHCLEVHHEKIANSIYQVNNEGIDKIKKNCETMETSPSYDDNDIGKFIESIRLSIVQRDFILKNVHQAGIEAEEIENTKSQIYTDIVAILGIFSALIFALFGGLNLVSSLSKLQDVRLGKVLLLSSFVTVSLIVLIFLLLNGISSMVGKQMKSCCNEENCNHTLLQKYPFFIIGICASLLVMMCSSIVVLLDYKGVIYSHNIVTLITIVAVFVIIFWGIYRYCFIEKTANQNG